MRSFEEARQFVHSLELQSQSDWVKFRRGQLPEKGPFPEDIPTNPSRTYKRRGWLSWGDWLGTNSIAPKDKAFLNFNDARSFVQKLKLKNRGAWRKACLEGRIPEEIPRTPERRYRDSGWISMGDWLGTGNVSNRDKAFRDFDSARDWARALGLQSSFQWRKFCSRALPEYGKRPEDIPANPERIYQKNGWRGYGDWLGTDAIATNLRDYLPFEEARAFVHSLNLIKTSEWRKFSKGQLSNKGTLPAGIPADPRRTYAKQGWNGMGDWLGKK